MTKPHWSRLCEPPEAGLGLWDLRLIQNGNPLWDKEHKTMNTKLGYEKGTGGFKPFLSYSLFQLFIRNVYKKLLPVCNSASPLHPRLASAPNHPQDPYRWGKWEELCPISVGRFQVSTYVWAFQPRLVWVETCLFHAHTAGRPSWTVKSHSAKPPFPSAPMSFTGQALHPVEVSVWGRERDSQRQVGVIAENKSLLGLSGFFPCPHYPGPEYLPSPRLSQTSFKNWFD